MSKHTDTQPTHYYMAHDQRIRVRLVKLIDVNGRDDDQGGYALVRGGDGIEWIMETYRLSTDEPTKLTTLLTTPLTTPAEAEAWLRSMVAIGYGTHPDDPSADVIDTRTGLPLFTEEGAALHDARMDEACALVDAYAISLDAFGAGLGVDEA